MFKYVDLKYNARAVCVAVFAKTERTFCLIKMSERGPALGRARAGFCCTGVC